MNVHTQQKGRVRTQQVGGTLHAKDRNLRETYPADTLILDIQPPGLGENEFLLFKPTGMCDFVVAVLTN